MTRFSVRARSGASLRMEEERPVGVLRQVARAAVRHRTTGHAAEMAFFAVVTLVPSTIAVGAALGFRVAAAFGLNRSGGVAAGDPSVQIIGQSANAVVATVSRAYLASIAILLGGEFNAILRERRSGG